MTRERKQLAEYLLSRYIDGNSTARETALLFRMLDEESSDEYWEPILQEMIAAEPESPEYDPAYWEGMAQNIIQRNPPRRSIVRRLRPRLVAVAASVTGLLGIGLYFYYTTRQLPTHLPVAQTNEIQAPASNKATITLADGSQVSLDSLHNGQIARQGNVQLVKLANGQISYESSNNNDDGRLQYNTLHNPRGSRVIDVRLSDGSHVWLNAGSSITYPVNFAGDQRHVELHGEGYFEVTHQPEKKFIVAANSTTTEVLGTHFNINAYPQTPDTRITLFTGRVKAFKDPDHALILKPGEQAGISASGLKLSRPDLDQVASWRKGLFNFNGVGIKEAMQQISNWYDVEVVYLSKVPTVQLGGELGRDLNLDEVIQTLQHSDIKCHLDGRKLMIE